MIDERAVIAAARRVVESAGMGFPRLAYYTVRADDLQTLADALGCDCPDPGVVAIPDR